MPPRKLSAVRRLLPIVLIALPVFGAHALTVTTASTGAAITVINGTPPLMTVYDVQRGQLLFNSTRHGKYAPAPLVATEIEIDIGGIVARTMVKQ